MRAFSRLRRHRGRILGLDVAGEVVEVGDGVTEFSQGDRVFGDLSEQGNGGFADHVSTALIAQLATHRGVRDIVGVDDAVKQEFMLEVGFAPSTIAQLTSPARSARHDASAFHWRDRSA